jgi:hypothetical protein
MEIKIKKARIIVRMEKKQRRKVDLRRLRREGDL